MKRSTFAVLIYWLVAGAAIALLTLWAAGISHGAVSDCHDATCRISAGNAKGTGCVFEISQGRVFVLTNAHVIGSANTVECEFWRHGHRSQPVRGRVILRNAPIDAAVVAVPSSAFGGILPTAVPLAERNTMLRPGQTVVSVGCPHGAWATGWKGHVLGYQGADVHFVPSPANGRSGSAIFDADGERIVALLRARTADDQQGIAVSVQSIYRAFDGRASSMQHSNLGRNTQCPGGICPVLPYRRYNDDHNRRQNGRIDRIENRVWPTMPYPAPTPAPQVDLAPIGGKLDRLIDSQDNIAKLLHEIRSERSPVVPVTPPADQEALKAAQQAKAETAAVKEASQKAVDEVKAESSKLREALNALIGDRETLKERFDARLAKVKEELGEDASRREVARAYVKDLAREKLGDGTVGLTGGKLVGAALGLSGPLAFALGAGLWLVSRRIGTKVEAGDPLLIQRVFDRLGDKIDDLRDRVRDVPAEQATPQRRAK